MMRSLYSAITGLKNHQISMDLIGNNISNVNTPGYKKQRAVFSTMLGQEIRGASAPKIDGTTTVTGGTNGISIGLGSILGSVDKIMGQGSSQYTGKATDIMIQGSGMFVLDLNGSNIYTRTGNFDFDKLGNLIDPGTGALVQGYANTSTPTDTDPPVVSAFDWSTATTGGFKFQLGQPLGDDTTTNLKNYTLQSYSIGQDGIITGVYSDGVNSVTQQMYKIAIATFPNQGGLIAQGNNYYVESTNSGPASIGAPGSDGRGMIVPNYLEMSNVDLSQEFTDMIVTQRGFQANARIITVSDTLLQELIDLKRS